MFDLPSAGESVCVLGAAQKRWAKLLDSGSMLYLYGMTGFGKTTQAISFAEQNYKDHVRFTANEDCFLEQAASWLKAHEKLTVKTLLILDDLQWVYTSEDRQTLFSLLIQNHRRSRLHIFLSSRAALPSYLNPLWMTQQLIVEDQEGLRLEKAQVRELILSNRVLQTQSAEKQFQAVEVVFQASKGYAVGAAAAVKRLAEYPEDANTAITLATKDVGNFLDQHLIAQWPSSRRMATLKLSVCSSFTTAMAERILGVDAEETGKILRDLLETGSFLSFTAPDTYRFVPFFKAYLEQRLKVTLKQEWRSLYETAGTCYEEQRKLEEALTCYRQAERTDKIVDLVIYLSENAEGCAFARIAQQYMETLPEEWEKSNPRLLGAKVMLCAYQMRTEECMHYLEQLRSMAEQKENHLFREEARRVYMRTVIACPYDTADTLKENLIKFADYAIHGGLPLHHIMPTGNLPSLINGGMDLLPWEKNKKLLYPVIKAASEKLMGVEAVGIADAAMGEILYEQNKNSKAMTSLTKALSDASLNGSLRVEFAVNGIMARLFQSEDENAAAVSVLQNIRQKALQKNFLELIPSIEASLALCALLENDANAYNQWLKQWAPDEHETFFITARFQLFVKAKVYTALGRTLEALHILDQLLEYTRLYHRTYFKIELLTLKAMILYRRGEEWQEVLLEAAQPAATYGLVRIFADQGIALLPLWQELEGNGRLSESYQSLILKECKAMAKKYPGYLEPPRRFAEITDKELAVLKLMARGQSNSQIAAELGINLGTSKFHVKNIMRKLGAGSRTEAVRTALEEGVL